MRLRFRGVHREHVSRHPWLMGEGSFKERERVWRWGQRAESRFEVRELRPCGLAVYMQREHSCDTAVGRDVCASQAQTDQAARTDETR